MTTMLMFLFWLNFWLNLRPHDHEWRPQFSFGTQECSICDWERDSWFVPEPCPEGRQGCLVLHGHYECSDPRPSTGFNATPDPVIYQGSLASLSTGVTVGGITFSAQESVEMMRVDQNGDWHFSDKFLSDLASAIAHRALEGK